MVPLYENLVLHVGDPERTETGVQSPVGNSGMHKKNAEPKRRRTGTLAAVLISPVLYRDYEERTLIMCWKSWTGLELSPEAGVCLHALAHEHVLVLRGRDGISEGT